VDLMIKFLLREFLQHVFFRRKKEYNRKMNKEEINKAL